MVLDFYSALRSRFNKLSVLANIARDYQRIGLDPMRHTRRIFAARGFKDANLKIDPDAGFLLSEADRIEGLPQLLAQLRPFALSRAEELADKHLVAAKPFYFNVLHRNDIRSMPELVKFTLSPAMLKILSPYYGLVPNLSHIGIFLSAHTGSLDNKGTQHGHFDNHDRRHVKMFCYLNDVSSDDGPLTFLPADKSLWFRRKTGRIIRSHPVRDDNEWRKYFSERDLVEVTGPAGTVAFLNTTDCLHFGSRCRPGGRRLTLVTHYTKFAEYSYARTTNYQDLNMATSPELRPSNLNEVESLMFHLVSNPRP